MTYHINDATISNEVYVVVVDGVGRQIIGRIDTPLKEALEKPFVTIHNPILVIDQVSKDGRINISMQPMSHVEMIDVIHIKWVSMYETTNKTRLGSYDELMLKLRAASSGLVTATQMPKDMLIGRN